MNAPGDTIGPRPSATIDALRSSIAVLRWTLLGLVAVYLASNVRVIGPNENALVLRLGRLTEPVRAPGLLLALPYPLDEVIVVPTRAVQEIQLDEWAAPAASSPQAPPDPATDAPPEPAAPVAADTLHPVRDGYALTGDANIVHLRFSVRYRVADPRDYALGARDRDGLLRRVLLDAAAGTLGSFAVDDALTSGQARLRHACQTVAQAKIDRLGLGVALQAWEIREIAPARQVLPAFEDVASAKVEAQTAVQKANANRQARLPEIEAKVFRIGQEADGAARRTLERARGEAAGFIAQWEVAKENIEAFRAQRQMEAIQRLMRRAWLPAVHAADGPAPQLILRPPAHDPEPQPDE